MSIKKVKAWIYFLNLSVSQHSLLGHCWEGFKEWKYIWIGLSQGIMLGYLSFEERTLIQDGAMKHFYLCQLKM